MLPTLIVGLGNPGSDYEATRHNAGYMVVDRILAGHRGPLTEERRCGSMVYTVRRGGRKLVLAKPLTFMNRSGGAVGKLARVLDLSAQEVFIVYDCVDLPLGRIRVRQQGSSGGHRGMESVLEALGVEQVPRLRVGVGRPEGATVEHVLSGWSADEVPAWDKVLAAAAEAVLLAVRAGVEKAMNTYNAWTPDPDPGDGDGHQQGD